MVIRTLTFYNGNRLPIVSVSHPLSKSTVGQDRGAKKTRYEKLGVAEYWVVDPEAKQIEQYVLDPATKHYQPSPTSCSTSCQRFGST